MGQIPAKVVRDAVEAVPAADGKRLLEKVRETTPNMDLGTVVKLAEGLVELGMLQAHGKDDARRYYPAQLEIKAEDLVPGPGLRSW